MMRPHLKTFLCCVLLFGIYTGSVSAQQSKPTAPGEAPNAAGAEDVSTSKLESLKGRVETASELSKDEKDEALKSLQESIIDLAAIENLIARELADREKLAKVSEDRLELQADLERLQKLTASTPEPDIQLAELEQTLAITKSELTQAQSKFDKVKAQTDGRAERLKSIADRMVAIPDEQVSLQAELAKLPTGAEATLLIESKRLAFLVKLKQLSVEPSALKSKREFLIAEASSKLPDLQKDIAARQVELLNQELQVYTNAVNRARRSELENRLADAKSEIEKIGELGENWKKRLLPVYEQNVKIIKGELDIQLKLEQVQSKIEGTRKQRESLATDLDEIQNREGHTGTSRRFGILLRQHRNFLPDAANLKRQVYLRGQTYEATQLYYFDRREERNRLDDIEEKIKTFANEVIAKADAEGQDAEKFEELYREAIKQQRDDLDAVITVCDRYIEGLGSYDSEQFQLAELSEEFAEYVDQRVLWIRSHEALSFRSVTGDVESLSVFVDGNRWSHLLSTLASDFWSHLFVYSLFVVVWVFLLASQSRQTRQLQHAGKKATSRLNTSMSPTLRTLLITFSKSVILPLPLMFVGWRLLTATSSETSTSEFILPLSDLATNFMFVSVLLFCLEFIRNVHRPQGLAPTHFHWTEFSCDVVFRQVKVFVLLATPLLVIISILDAWDTVQEAARSNVDVAWVVPVDSEVTTAATDHSFDDSQSALLLNLQTQDVDSDAIFRVFSMALFLLLAATLHRLTDNYSGAISPWVKRNRNGWVDRFASLLHLLVVVIPIALAVLTAIGFTYAADRLAIKFGLTILLLFGVEFVRSLFLLWLTMRQRRLAIEQVRQARKELLQASSKSQVATKSTVPEVKFEKANLVDVNTQTRRLLNTSSFVLSIIGVGMIWTDVLPALHYFDAWTLPGTILQLPEIITTALIAVLTATAARNIPGLLQITLLEWLPLEKSSRYAIGAITQYLIAIVGLLAISGQLGIGWEDVQWLAAGLTVGLGFGLQEIFANFVSGLIILFEQPVRVGDVVTIDGVSGVVNRIRIRSTTITDWDRKEYIVPNREFITGKLLNWTLSDTVNRVVIEVGVAYGTDPNSVQEIILKTVSSHHNVMHDPGPIVTFDGFGDSALNFTLRAYLPSLDSRLRTIHELHTTIIAALEKAGIEIPFPQRDLNIRSSVALPHVANTSILKDNSELPNEYKQTDSQE